VSVKHVYALHIWLVVFLCQNNAYRACSCLQYIFLEIMVWKLNIRPEVPKSQASGCCDDLSFVWLHLIFVDPKHATCFMPSVQCLAFLSGFQILGKFVHPCIRQIKAVIYLKMHFWVHLAFLCFIKIVVVKMVTILMPVEQPQFCKWLLTFIDLCTAICNCVTQK